MSKFIIQMVLSVAVAVSAAIGFSPSVKDEVSKGLRGAKSFAHEVTQSILHATSSVETESDVSAEASLEKHFESDVKSELQADVDLDKSSKKKKSATNLEASLSTASETEAQIGSNETNLDLENELEAGLELDTGILK